MLLRKRKCRNLSLSENLRTYEGEFILFIECAWSLAYRGDKICDSSTDNGADGKMLRGLHRLIGANAGQVTISSPPRHATMSFTKDLSLQLTAHVSTEDAADNYSLVTPEMTFIVGPTLRLRSEPRKSVVDQTGVPIEVGVIPSSRSRKIAVPKVTA
jgi:hypothetical protein